MTKAVDLTRIKSQFTNRFRATVTQPILRPFRAKVFIIELLEVFNAPFAPLPPLHTSSSLFNGLSPRNDTTSNTLEQSDNSPLVRHTDATGATRFANNQIRNRETRLNG